MKKKILIGIGIVVVAVAGFYIYMNSRVLSPGGETELTVDNLSVSITYSRPSVRGRLIFGQREQNALQPYGEYWRLGANMATEITFNKDVAIQGQPVKAGTYRMYAVPGEREFDIILNTGLGKSGSEQPDHSLDILTTKVPVQRSTAPVEQFTVTMTSSSAGIDVVFEWSDVKFVVPVANQ